MSYHVLPCVLPQNFDVFLKLLTHDVLIVLTHCLFLVLTEVGKNAR